MNLDNIIQRKNLFKELNYPENFDLESDIAIDAPKFILTGFESKSSEYIPINTREIEQIIDNSFKKNLITQVCFEFK